jgi:hypothetical protein
MLSDCCAWCNQVKGQDDVDAEGRNSSGPGKVSAQDGLVGAATFHDSTTCSYCGSDAIHALRKELNEQLFEQKRQLDEKLDKILMIVSGLKVPGSEPNINPIDNTTPVAAALSQQSLKSRNGSRPLSQQKANRYECDGVMASLCFADHSQSHQQKPSGAE